MGELLPCPFCGNAPNPDPQNDDCPVPAGSRADGEFYLTIWCEACGAEGGKRLTRADAITAWNTRPRTEGRGDQKPRVDDLAMLVRMLVQHVPETQQIHGRALDYLARHGLSGSPLRASPIREPEISRTKRDEIARIIDPEIFADLDLVASQAPQFIPSYSGQRNVDAAYAKADAILNLAPVGGRGEGCIEQIIAERDAAQAALEVCRLSLVEQGSARRDPTMPVLIPEVIDALEGDAEAQYAMAMNSEERRAAHGLSLLVNWQRVALTHQEKDAQDV